MEIDQQRVESFQAKEIPLLSEKQRRPRLKFARKYSKLKFLFTYECRKYLVHYPNPENHIVWSSQECNVPSAYQVMVWGSMTGRGLTKLYIFPKGLSQWGCSKHGTRLKISRFHGARLIFTSNNCSELRKSYKQHGYLDKIIHDTRLIFSQYGRYFLPTSRQYNMRYCRLKIAICFLKKGGHSGYY